MPRWKALPEELDPQVKEFANQLRRLVDRSGLSIAAVADRTGYSKTSWERYLNGRLLAPKGAIVALAEVTGTNQSHLTTMWELAERAWSRSEMRHDMTMEAIRISQARAALGELGPTSAPAAGRSSRSGGRAGAGAGVSTAPGPGEDVRDAGRPPSVPVQRGAVPRIPQQPRHGAGPDAGAPGGVGPADGFHAAGAGAQPPDRRAGRGGQPGSRRKLTMFLVGVVGALLVIAGAVLLTDLGADDAGKKTATPSAEPSTTAPELPAGVGCTGADCTGQDPEAMGCGGQFASTVSRATVGTSLVEVRYSKTCAAAWARITKAAPGDTVRISAGAGAGGQDGTVDADADAYTPMVAVKKASDAKACATLASGTEGCTTPE
ncbi:XRE family transcriptional regulator [Streptomyces sp. NPDC001876]|uniref:XRE family transcriptional regulator n=1 Tax=Streptomyces sp. NPDC001876 TaxID=3154402 RepID=UPI00331D3D07